MQQEIKEEVDLPYELAGTKRPISDLTVWLLALVRPLMRRTPYDTSTETGRSKERYRRVALTTLTSVGARGLGAFAALVSVPLTLSYLGRERYGVWMTISSIVAMLSFADFGMGNGLLNAVAVANGKNDRESMRKFVSSAFFLLSGTALLIAFLFTLAYPRVAWPALFNVTPGIARNESGPAVVALAACFIINLPLGIVQRIQVGHQEGFMSDLWQGIGSLLSLIAVLLGVHLKWGLPRLILAVSAAPVAATILNGVFLFGWARPWLLPRWDNFRWAAARTLASNGFLFFLLQIGYVVSFSSDNLIVAHVLGASAVPQYAVAQRVFLMVPLMQTTWLAPLWPAYGEAIQRGDNAWVRRTLKRSIMTVVVVSTGLSASLVAVSRPLFKLWVGPELVPPWPLAIGLALWAIVQAAGSAVAMFLNGSNALGFQIRLSIALILLATPLKILMCIHMGTSGIVWGALIAYFFVFSLPLWLVLPKMLSKHEEACTT
jgi:O-antigen/teichoic acid export membrane protein